MNRYLLQFIIAMVAFGTIGIFRRFIPLDSGLIAMIRGAVGALFILGYLKVKGRPFRFSHLKGKLLPLVIAGGVMGFNWVLLFEAYNYTTVSVATLCYYMQPMFLLMISPILFKEKITPAKGMCVLIAFAGMVLVSGILTDQGNMNDIRGILLGLGSAVLYTFVVAMNKKIEGCDPYEKTAVELASAAIAVFPYLLIKGVFADPATAAGFTPLSIAMLAVISVIHTGVMYVLYFGSIEHIKMQQVAIFGYLDPVVALILSAVILHENIGITGVLGAAMIIGAAIASELLPSAEETA